MLPVEADVPDLLVEMGYGKGGTSHAKAIGDLSMIAFYYLYALGNIRSKGNEKTKNKQFSSSLRTCNFSRETKRAPSCASQELLP